MEEHAGPDRRWLPDAAELDRLRAASDGRAPDGWAAWFDPSIGYLARPPDGPGDLVPAYGVPPAALARVLATAAPTGMDAWIRDVDDTHPLLVLPGVETLRRLLILERPLDGPIPAPRRTIQPFDPARDEAALVRLLADAYAGSPDGWDAARVADEIRRPGFSPQDVLVARSVDRPDELDGAHWTLRRDERTGEVHNLCVHPSARGRGLADDLLVAGLAHLQGMGLERVILWVDADNEAARHLYARREFTLAWQDALVRIPPSAVPESTRGPSRPSGGRAAGYPASRS